MDEKKALHQVERIREQYTKMQRKCSDQQELYDSAREGSREKEKILQKLESVKDEYSEVKKEYAACIYSYFAAIKPNLVIRKTNEIVTWNSIFPESEVEPQEDQIRSIIALVEEDGGKYRLQNSWQS